MAEVIRGMLGLMRTAEWPAEMFLVFEDEKRVFGLVLSMGTLGQMSQLCQCKRHPDLD